MVEYELICSHLLGEEKFVSAAMSPFSVRTEFFDGQKLIDNTVVHPQLFDVNHKNVNINPRTQNAGQIRKLLEPWVYFSTH